ncbi:uncharacterized protein F5891DRAFT_1188855 [Suillus fuscotomentosus]|uniref:Uncharacterized protein n=1 Tax=Suillus fuscotomentosus TaxID=1912939 RepID=A0AAD4HKP8_9AGAM|nr:uncharacterized protein F5891DRAFT_1188855 [Suillus fuscotomentosus]KAG1900163.1 hypothetical protein F5891DRAFT_1188855 [Suillus fuscotomentosus]
MFIPLLTFPLIALLTSTYSLCLSFGHLQTAAASGQRQCYSDFQSHKLDLKFFRLTFWLSMSPGTGASNFGLWGLFFGHPYPRDWYLHLWPSMSLGTGASNLGSGVIFWSSMSSGTGTFTFGIWGLVCGHPCPQGLAPLPLGSGGWFLAIHVPRDWRLYLWDLRVWFVAIHVPRD